MKHSAKLLSLALFAALALSLSAMAANTPLISPAPDTGTDGIAAAPAGPLAPVRIWGKVTKGENGSLLITSGDPNAVNPEVVVHLPEGTPCVDAVSGLPLDMSKVKDGDTLYAWAGPAMTLSLPPQTTAIAVVGNLPADYKAPELYEITGVDQTVQIAVSPKPERTEVNLPVAGGTTLRIPLTARISPWLTRQIVTVDDLRPGSRILVWSDSENNVEKVLLFPYGYRGTLTGTAASNGDWLVCVNGTFEAEKYPDAVQALCKKMDDGTAMVPLRKVAEAVNYDVAWVSGQGAVVKEGDKVLFSVLPGSETVKRSEEAGGDWTLSTACVLEKGVTYLPLHDLVSLLNLYFFEE